jgi:hypothetical protein
MVTVVSRTATLTCWHTAVLQDAAMLCSICMLPRLLQLGTH